MWKTWAGGPNASPISSPAAGGYGGATLPGGWHPTVVGLLLLIAAELIVVAFLSRTVLR